MSASSAGFAACLSDASSLIGLFAYDKSTSSGSGSTVYADFTGCTMKCMGVYFDSSTASKMIFRKQLQEAQVLYI